MINLHTIAGQCNIADLFKKKFFFPLTSSVCLFVSFVVSVSHS